MIWGVTRYEMKLQIRSLVFWLGVVLVAMMFYSEVWQEPSRRADMAQAMAAGEYNQPGKPGLGPSLRTELERILAHGIPSALHAAQWADRMQIVFAFLTLFTVGFLLERDRLSKSQEVLLAHPVGAFPYLVGKYLGAVIPLLLLSVLLMAGAMLVNAVVNTGLGHGWEALVYLKAWAVLLVPTILYSSALVLTLALLLGRAAAVVPIHLIYMGLGGLIPLGKAGFRLDWSTFIVRTEGRALSIWTEEWSALLGNRALYLALTACLLALAVGLYRRRVQRDVTAS